MAITNLGTNLKLSSNKIPSGYTPLSVVTFADHEYKRNLVLSVPKATVQNATAATTFANIINNASVGINKQITDLIAAEFLATATVTTHAVFYDITTNISNTSKADFYTDAVETYDCSVELYIKSV